MARVRGREGEVRGERRERIIETGRGSVCVLFFLWQGLPCVYGIWTVGVVVCNM